MENTTPNPNEQFDNDILESIERGIDEYIVNLAAQDFSDEENENDKDFEAKEDLRKFVLRSLLNYQRALEINHVGNWLAYFNYVEHVRNRYALESLEMITKGEYLEFEQATIAILKSYGCVLYRVWGAWADVYFENLRQTCENYYKEIVLLKEVQDEF